MVMGIHSHMGLRERVLQERVWDKVFLPLTKPALMPRVYRIYTGFFMGIWGWFRVQVCNLLLYIQGDTPT